MSVARPQPSKREREEGPSEGFGLLRFPDVYTRLHALTKADNLGLGFIVLGLAVQADSLAMACKLLLIWPLVLAASATVGYSIARRANELGIAPAIGKQDAP